jgi:hypothetical protein
VDVLDVQSHRARALLTSPTDSDSDSDVDTKGNRGQKLKKRARFAHRGQLVPSVGPSAYKEVGYDAALQGLQFVC